ncbi:MAG: HAD family phosphatase [Oscillospiraceae bacterium]|jgi:HAD superfamily hydrolase (TIGR01509 family)|nr:HAD family phosphatase [Oscillospiraceae bacterium]
MDKQYAIFDMDGTLVDSMPYWCSLAREYLEKKGVKDVSVAILDQIRPMTMTESGSLFIREYGFSCTPEDVADEMNAMMVAHYRTDVPLKSGAKEYLSRLKARGVRMCVASATAEPLMEICLDRLGVLGYFDFLISCETVGVGKNRPDVYLEAARRLGGAPERTAVYEDAVFAAKTAKTAGFYVVGVYDESADAHWADLMRLADETICDFKEEV